MKLLTVSDVTDFNSNGQICVAMIDNATGECFRPTSPYFKYDDIKKSNLYPGVTFEADIIHTKKENPHTEDAYFKSLNFNCKLSDDEFQKLLNKTLKNSISEGFNYSKFEETKKYIPVSITSTDCSIITIKIFPSQLRILKDTFNCDKIKAELVDNDGQQFDYLPIKDIGFNKKVSKLLKDNNFDTKINDLAPETEIIYLRIGLTRRHKPKNSNKNGYWVQINGIYTFPNFKNMRIYE